VVHFSFAIYNKTRGRSAQNQKNFFTRKNYPQKVDTDIYLNGFDKKIYLCILIVYSKYTKGILEEKFLKLSMASNISQKEKRGHKFVIYTDDSNIYLKSKRASQRVMKSITTFLKVKLRLKVNLHKSAVDIPDKRKFLGFTLYHYHERIRIRIAPQAIKRFKIKICEITSRSNGQNIIKKRILRLNLYLRGWIQYFSLSDSPIS
jgi:hypothetical protein